MYLGKNCNFRLRCTGSITTICISGGFLFYTYVALFFLLVYWDDLSLSVIMMAFFLLRYRSFFASRFLRISINSFLKAFIGAIIVYVGDCKGGIAVLES